MGVICTLLLLHVVQGQDHAHHLHCSPAGVSSFILGPYSR